VATAEELHKKLDAIKQQRARLEGKREQAIKELSDLGFNTPAEVKEELDRLNTFLADAEPAYVAAYEKFTQDYGHLLAGLQGLDSPSSRR
jgi:hypothetical protein